MALTEQHARTWAEMLEIQTAYVAEPIAEELKSVARTILAVDAELARLRGEVERLNADLIAANGLAEEEAEEVLRLQSLIKRLTSESPMVPDEQDGTRACLFCGGLHDYLANKDEHEPDCVWVEGRAALGEAAK